MSRKNSAKSTTTRKRLRSTARSDNASTASRPKSTWRKGSSISPTMEGKEKSHPTPCSMNSPTKATFARFSAMSPLLTQQLTDALQQNWQGYAAKAMPPPEIENG